jgi:anaerobic C4-dicarboxylate transporter DcuA
VNVSFFLQFGVVLAAIAMGARVGGVGLGLWGGVGLLALTAVFGATPTSPPIDVMLIILAVISAAAVMEASGGIDYLVSVAERIIRSNPKHVTLVAPLVAWAFTFGAGTGHIVYPLQPVIYEVAHENGIRPERPMAVATIASQQAITASPVSAATAAMIGLLAPQGIGLIQILAICVPATLIGVIVAALIQTRVGTELHADAEYKRRLEAGEIQPALGADRQAASLPWTAKVSALIFLTGVALVVIAGAFPQVRPLVAGPNDTRVPLAMPLAIQMVMLSVAGLIMLVTKPQVSLVPRTQTAQAGFTAVIGIFGLAWLGDTFIANNQPTIIGALSDMANSVPALFAVGLFIASVFLYSQAATTRALMPLGISLGIPGAALIGMFPAVNGYFFFPTYGSLIAAINFDRSGTTRIGRFILNHSFMLPGLVSTVVAVAVGLAIAQLF